MNSKSFLPKNVAPIIVVLLISTSYSSSSDIEDPLYTLEYDDESIYAEYNDTFDPVPECSIMQTCPNPKTQQSNSELEEDVSSVISSRSVCETYVNCYEYDVFPPDLPPETTILNIQGSFFHNITGHNMKNLTSLYELVMEFNEIQSIEPGAFRNQKQLEILRLHGNFLKNLYHGIFRGLTSLKALDLSKNGIGDIRDFMFAEVTGLKSLNLNSNLISALSSGVFRHLFFLEDLSLEQNNLSSIPRMAFEGLNNLKTLNLRQNNFNKIPTLSIRRLLGLGKLFLSRNPIASIRRDDFNGLDSLRHLWLDECLLDEVQPKTFHGLNLMTLVLEHNRITRLPDLGEMKELKVLKLHANPWVCDYRAVSMLKWLIRHEVKNTNIPCQSPPNRQGNDLLIYTVNDLLNDTNIQKTSFFAYTETSLKSSHSDDASKQMNMEKHSETFSGSDEQLQDSIFSKMNTQQDFSHPTLLLNVDAVDELSSIENAKDEVDNNEKHEDNIGLLKTSSDVSIKGFSLREKVFMESTTSRTKIQRMKKDDIVHANSIFTITLASVVIVSAVLLLVITGIVVKKVFRSRNANVVSKVNKPKKSMIKRRRSGRYDFSKARAHQVNFDPCVYGVFSKPTNEEIKN